MAGIDLSQSDLARGGGLLEEGGAQIQRVNQMGAAAAQSESERTMYNSHVQAGNKAGISQVLGAVGSAAGMAFGGPVGAALGGMAGGMIGSSL